MDTPDKNELICYCFGYTVGDIESDTLTHSPSLIMEKIASEKKTGGCDCTSKNPKKR
jgi:hypothetical protein